MQPPQTYDEVLAAILKIPMFGTTGIAAMNYNLDRMHRWSRRLGHPERSVPTIHVAGTNGKGTTCRMLASVYMAAGYKTALYTSPHLKDLRERIRLQNKLIPKDAVVTFYREHYDALLLDPPTFFELLTLLAFWYFANEQAEIAIIETGLGGRLDATNIATPRCTIITSIGYDHKDILGDTLEEIAAEKAGIIKRGVPLILGQIPSEARSIIFQRADAMHARVVEPMSSTQEAGQKLKKHLPHGKPLAHVGQVQFEEPRGNPQTPQTPQTPHPSNHLRPPTDLINQTVAKNTIHTLQTTLPVPNTALLKGLSHWHEHLRPHANFEQVASFKSQTGSTQTWFFSGAHNPQAWEDLITHLKTIAPAHEWAIILSLMADKITPSIRPFFKPFDNLYLYSMNTERAATPDILHQTLPWGTIIHEPSEIPALRQQKERSGLVIFTGSLYFYNTVERWVQTIQTTVFRG